MDNQELIKSLYKILLLFEDVNNSESNVTLEDYLIYLDRVSIRFLGKGNNEIYDMICGLMKMGDNINHKRIKSIVFHMIKKVGGDGYAS